MNKIITLVCLVFALCCNAQQIQTYKGNYNKSFQYVYMRDLTVTYDYYENDDLTRVYHGPFSLRFSAESKKGQKRYGTIKGQFKNGYYDGDWTFVYPYMVDGYSNAKGFYSTPYTATLKCSFDEGNLNGAVEVVVTNSSNKVVAKSTVQYKDGLREGEVNHFSNMKYPEFNTLQGQYKNDRPYGKWTYTQGKDKGIATYDENGSEVSNYVIDYQSGEKEYGKIINLSKLDYSSALSYTILLDVIRDISIDRSKRFHFYAAIN